MVRQLYRTYLYLVCITLLSIATAMMANALGLLLSATSLRGATYEPPEKSQVVQSLVTLATVWIVTLLFGGLHYRLMRRDLRDDPKGANGGVRSFFLNMPQLVLALVAIVSFANGLSYLGVVYSNSTSAFGSALACAGMLAILQWERHRTQASTDVARAFQQLHLYGVQIGSVFSATVFWANAAYSTVKYVLLTSDGNRYCQYYYGGDLCGPNPNLPPGSPYLPQADQPIKQVIFTWAAVLFVALCWAAYTYFTRADRNSRLRQVLHLIAFGYGLGFLISGGQGVLAILLRQAVNRPFAADALPGWLSGSIGWLLFGAAVALAYWFLYARESSSLPSGVPAAGLLQLAVATVVFAYPFWIGLYNLLSDVFERIVPQGTHSLAEDSVILAARFLVGLPFVFLLIQLSLRTRQTGVTWPQRILWLVLLAGGTVATAIGLVVTLQTVISTVLGAPSDNWQHTARQGLVGLLVGGAMVAIFGTLAIRNRYLAGKPQPPQETTPPAIEPVTATASSGETLEGILDALLAGRLSRDQAAARIRQNVPVS